MASASIASGITLAESLTFGECLALLVFEDGGVTDLREEFC
jgi:hypothetical protein